jgi:hypothetical protein
MVSKKAKKCLSDRNEGTEIRGRTIKNSDSITNARGEGTEITGRTKVLSRKKEESD